MYVAAVADTLLDEVKRWPATMNASPEQLTAEVAGLISYDSILIDHLEAGDYYRQRCGTTMQGY